MEDGDANLGEAGFPSQSDRLGALGDLLQGSATTATIIIALLAIASTGMFPPIILGLLRISGGTALVATYWSLSSIADSQQISLLEEGPYGVLNLGLIFVTAAYTLFAIPSLTSFIGKLFEIP